MDRPVVFANTNLVASATVELLCATWTYGGILCGRDPSFMTPSLSIGSDIRSARIPVDAVSSCSHEVTADQGTSTLISWDTDVGLPRELSKVRFCASYYTLLNTDHWSSAFWNENIELLASIHRKTRGQLCTLRVPNTEKRVSALWCQPQLGLRPRSTWSLDHFL